MQFSYETVKHCIPMTSVYGRGSQPFSDHVPLQHSDRWVCTPSAFQHMNMYP